MRDREIEIMLDALADVMEERYMSHAGMARLLGFSPSHVSLVFAGKRRPGVRFIAAVMEQFPEIRRLLAESLDEQEDS